MSFRLEPDDVLDYLFPNERQAWDYFLEMRGRIPSESHFLYHVATLRAALLKLDPYGECPLCHVQPARPGEPAHADDCFFETLPRPGKEAA